jgi:hypothetical protein
LLHRRLDVGLEILRTNCPGLENLKLKFARTLRTNFQSLGDYEGVNLAIQVELAATELHLKKAWGSPEAYYRAKHKGLDRFRMFLSWLAFRALDLVWGNGESTWKLVRSVALLFVAMAVVHVIVELNPGRLPDYWKSFWMAPQIFFGVYSPPSYAKWYLALICFLRLTAFGFFMAIILKRFNRR